MKAPDPLPEPGAWIVTADGSVYEVEGTAPTADGVHYVSVDSGEVIWTPWSDVEWCGTYEEADSVSERIWQRDDATFRALGLLGIDGKPRGAIAHTTRWDVAIYHAPGTVVPDHLRTAVQGIIQAALRVSGIDDAAVLITEAP